MTDLFEIFIIAKGCQTISILSKMKKVSLQNMIPPNLPPMSLLCRIYGWWKSHHHTIRTFGWEIGVYLYIELKNDHSEIILSTSTILSCKVHWLMHDRHIMNAKKPFNSGWVTGTIVGVSSVDLGKMSFKCEAPSLRHKFIDLTYILICFEQIVGQQSLRTEHSSSSLHLLQLVQQLTQFLILFHWQLLPQINCC